MTIVVLISQIIYPLIVVLRKVGRFDVRGQHVGSNFA